MPGNLLVLQSGGCTAVMNASLAGVLRAAAERAGLRLTRVTVPGEARLGILKQLNRLGVESEKLFPDLPGMCAHERWVAEWLW